MKANVKAMKSRKSRATKNIEPSSGNVFADLGFHNAEERLLKTKLATRVAEVIKKKGWTQLQTAQSTGLDQSRVSQLLRGQLAGFSNHDLFAILSIVSS